MVATLLNMIISTVSIVNFEQPVYSVNEHVGSIQPVLVFSEPSLYNMIIVQVLAGKCLLVNIIDQL